MVDAICRAGTRRLVAPAVPPRPRGAAEMAETFLARMDGTPFEATVADGSELIARLERWARPVTADAPVLVLQLDPPDRGKAWRLSVHTRGDKGKLTPVEVTIATAKDPVRRAAEAQLTRMERLLPVLTRPGGTRRGEVLLATDEAWHLMTVDGPVVADAGFDVRVPALSRRRPSPTLRLVSEGTTGPAAVGAAQLCKVRWSVCFDDVELTAADLAALTAQARPLVRSRGRWVELDRADLAEAAAALAEQSAAGELTGGAILRHALGLEGGGLAGHISVDGTGWAADLLRRATSAPPGPLPEPDGFVGQLRDYQAQSRGWLAFLDDAGLGGCLALDMGLGKTPILLAHLLEGKGKGPSLVVTPPAVLGNWAAEAAKFTPDLRVVSHHGPGRADTNSRINRAATEADVVLTTYATAVRDVELLSTVDWARVVIDEAQAIKNPASDTAQALRRIPARSRVALTGTPVENGLGDLWSILDFTNPGLVGSRNSFIANLSRTQDGGGTESALRALNGLLVFRRTKAEPAIAEELPDKIDQLDHCTMTAEQIGLYQAVLDDLVAGEADLDKAAQQSRILAAITALKQICNHPAAYTRDGEPLAGRSGKLARLEEIVEAVYAADERVLVFTHFATWGDKLATHLTGRFGLPVSCYHGGLTTTVRDRMIQQFQQGKGAGALVLSLKAGGSGLNLTAANHVVLYDRWWNPAAEDQARDRSWRLGQTHKVISHRLVCPGTVDERVEEVVSGKRRIADLVLPKQSSLADLGAEQLRAALGLRPEEILEEEPGQSDEVDAA
jgi:superfamily II DNA or RNA helicase